MSFILRNIMVNRRFYSGRRGLTLIELLIAAAISSFVMASVLSIQYITARTLKELYGPTRSRSARMSALNQIRLRLCDAKAGSVVISDDNHRIRFIDPNHTRSGVEIQSEFYFDPSDKTLYYDVDVENSNPVKLVKGPINITFRKGSRELDPPDYRYYRGEDIVVTIFVQTSDELAYSKVDLRDGETAVYLRNY
ncbi:prepilin-type N-terminal cleavage/methylation domain-containing protein [Candidatus Sumerlaeota bacterium]|nr:prepilin-type N-terminal cleavage/methylation domain-containing protein [Candidatus Sumerlaeota bacterium]